VRWRRDALFFFAGLWVGMIVGPVASVFAQPPVTAAGSGQGPGLVSLDQGTAAALTKFFTDLGRRVWGGERQAPGWAPLLLAAIFGPALTALIAVSLGINLTDGPTVAKVVIGGWLAATGGAVLLTAMHDQSRDPAANVPASLTTVPPQERAQLCCLHGDCRTVQMAGTQAAAGQPAVPVEAAQPVPTSPPNPPPPNPPSGPGVGVMDAISQTKPPPWLQRRP
jgi:hypothetical protein